MEYDGLTCLLCCHQFDEDAHLPQMIPQCGHTFCLKCLKSLLDEISIGEDFICPEDRIAMELPDKDLSRFPINYILLRLVEKRKYLKGFDKKGNPSQSIRRCITKEEDCSTEEISYMKRHATEVPQTHRSCGSTSNNSSSSESLKDEENVCMNNDNNVCAEHQRNCEVVCIDHKCRICTNCALFGSHRHHEIRSEGDVLKEIAGRAEKLIDLFQLMDRDQKKVTDQGIVEKFRMKAKEKYNEIAKIVHEKFEEYINLIKAKEKKVLEDISLKFKTMEDRFSELKQIPPELEKKIKKWKSSVQKLLTSATEISERGDIAFDLLEERGGNKKDLLKVGHGLINDMQLINEIPMKPFEYQLSKVKVVFQQDNFAHYLDSVCKLSIPSSEQRLESRYSHSQTQFFNQRLSQSIYGDPSKFTGYKGDESDDIINLDIYHRPTITESTAEGDLKNIIEWGSESQIQPQDDELSPFRSLLGVSSTKSIIRRSSSHNNHLSNKENHPPSDLSPPPTRMRSETNGQLLLENSSRIQNKTMGNKELKKEKRYGTSDGPIDPYKTPLASSVSPIKGDAMAQFLKSASQRNDCRIPERLETVIEGIRRKTLRTADLGGAGLGDAGVYALAELLKANHNLKSLKLIKNKITDEGGLALVGALYFNTGLTTLNLSQNLMTESTIDAFIELCRIRKTIKTIYFNQNNINSKNLKQKVRELAKLGVSISV